MDDNVKIITGHTAQQWVIFPELHQGYCDLMREFHGDTFFIKKDQFSALLRARTELIVFALAGQKILATAQATLVQTPPIFQVMFSNVVVAQGSQKNGVGRALVEYLETCAKAQWGKDRSLRIFLTNAPSKQNGAFYEKLDFTPRIDDRATVVWEKIV